ncbi:hypothetical protein [Ligilactobacillus equi]|uniref:Uncharacterized protein n=2 Tax=Ligilactobacillus equi TaxID=137357 RepID=V7HX48_9LACO|nr:hypothetical protein [Ligilactobacillus equi]ETA73788.1 hypothetical protein LEQ_0091c [Ligilactobacillus equi DPC 6820]
MIHLFDVIFFIVFMILTCLQINTANKEYQNNAALLRSIPYQYMKDFDFTKLEHLIKDNNKLVLLETFSMVALSISMLANVQNIITAIWFIFTLIALITYFSSIRYLKINKKSLSSELEWFIDNMPSDKALKISLDDFDEEKNNDWK